MRNNLVNEKKSTFNFNLITNENVENKINKDDFINSINSDLLNINKKLLNKELSINDLTETQKDSLIGYYNNHICEKNKKLNVIKEKILKIKSK
jgi:hypothetical protein